MKCPRCWAEKAYVHPMEGWKGVLLDCLLLMRMKCRHCYHKFIISWFFTIGKQVTPPPSRSVAGHSPGASPQTLRFAPRQSEAVLQGRRKAADCRRADAA